MFKARITKWGARRLLLPEGTMIEYDKIKYGMAADNIYVDGEYAGGTVSFVGKRPSIELVTWPEDFSPSLWV